MAPQVRVVAELEAWLGLDAHCSRSVRATGHQIRERSLRHGPTDDMNDLTAMHVPHDPSEQRWDGSRLMTTGGRGSGLEE